MNPLSNPLSPNKAVGGNNSQQRDGSRMSSLPGFWGRLGRRANIHAQPSTQTATAGPPLNPGG